MNKLLFYTLVIIILVTGFFMMKRNYSFQTYEGFEDIQVGKSCPYDDSPVGNLLKNLTETNKKKLKGLYMSQLLSNCDINKPECSISRYYYNNNDPDLKPNAAALEFLKNDIFLKSSKKKCCATNYVDTPTNHVCLNLDLYEKSQSGELKKFNELIQGSVDLNRKVFKKIEKQQSADRKTYLQNQIRNDFNGECKKNHTYKPTRCVMKQFLFKNPETSTRIKYKHKLKEYNQYASLCKSNESLVVNDTDPDLFNSQQQNARKVCPIYFLSSKSDFMKDLKKKCKQGGYKDKNCYMVVMKKMKKKTLGIQKTDKGIRARNLKLPLHSSIGKGKTNVDSRFPILRDSILQ